MNIYGKNHHGKNPNVKSIYSATVKKMGNGIKSMFSSNKGTVPIILVRHGENMKQRDFGQLSKEGTAFAKSLDVFYP